MVVVVVYPLCCQLLGIHNPPVAGRAGRARAPCYMRRISRLLGQQLSVIRQTSFLYQCASGEGGGASRCGKISRPRRRSATCPPEWKGCLSLSRLGWRHRYGSLVPFDSSQFVATRWSKIPFIASLWGPVIRDAGASYHPRAVVDSTDRHEPTDDVHFKKCKKGLHNTLRCCI